jgi:hypothetical protein
VKKSKLDFELAKSGAPGDKQQERERSNRASAAASRAKLLFYASTLEERTDRLEQERNLARDKLVVKRVNMTRVRKERDELRAVLADVWSIGDKRTCDWLVEVNAFRHVEDSEGSGADECEVGQGVFGEDREANVGRGTRRAMDVSTLQVQRGLDFFRRCRSCRMVRPRKWTRETAFGLHCGLSGVLACLVRHSSHLCRGGEGRLRSMGHLRESGCLAWKRK